MIKKNTMLVLFALHKKINAKKKIRLYCFQSMYTRAPKSADIRWKVNQKTEANISQGWIIY